MEMLGGINFQEANLTTYDVIFQKSVMSDCYRLECINSMKTIKIGIGESLQRDTFQDTMLICRDGMMTHNKLTLGLLLPELAAVPMFCLPVDHTILLLDYSLAELHSCIAEIFTVVELSPSANIGKKESVAGGMSSKPECLFGSSCFRRNPVHHQQYHHDELVRHYEEENIEDKGKESNTQPQIY